MPASSPVTATLILAGLSFASGALVFYVGARVFLNPYLARSKFFMLLEVQKSSLLQFLAVWIVLASLAATIGLVYTIREVIFKKRLISLRRLNVLQLCALASLPTSAFASIFVTLRDVKYSSVTVEMSLATLEIHLIICIAMLILFMFGPLLSLVLGIVGAIPLLHILGADTERSIALTFQKFVNVLPPSLSVVGEAPMQFLVICALVNAAYKYLFDHRGTQSDLDAGQISP